MNGLPAAITLLYVMITQDAVIVTRARNSRAYSDRALSARHRRFVRSAASRGEGGYSDRAFAAERRCPPAGRKLSGASNSLRISDEWTFREPKAAMPRACGAP